jgi:hypothetical protein
MPSLLFADKFDMEWARRMPQTIPAESATYIYLIVRSSKKYSRNGKIASYWWPQYPWDHVFKGFLGFPILAMLRRGHKCSPKQQHS